MSKPSLLAHKIRSLPEIGDELSRITIARSVKTGAEDAVARLTAVLRQAPYIDDLIGGDLVAATNDAISKSVAQARNLKKHIQKEKFGSEKKISEGLHDLVSTTQAIERRRSELWSKVQARVGSTETILQVSATTGLESAETLRVAVTVHKQATASPPSSKADVDRIRAAEEGSKAAIEKSGLTGNVKRILDGAIVGNGDAKLLLEVDVQEFLSKHPSLWGSLKLTLA